MKEVSNKIASGIMALLVLFSSMSFSVDMHFCGNHLMDYSIFGDVDTCMMQLEKTDATNKCSMMDMKMDCCSDVELSFKGQDDLKISFDKIALEQQVFVASFIYSYIHLFEGYHQDIVLFKDYSPPRLIRDTLILDQSFLI